MNIMMVDLKEQYKRIEKELKDKVSKVLESGVYIGGTFVKEFEEKMKSYLKVNHAISCANGTDALMVSMMALGIKPEDEVITTPFTFVSTAETIRLLGARPVYVDIDSKTYNINSTKIEEKITAKTKAIIPVHIWGQSADMYPIKKIADKHNIPIIEDAAQAVGATYEKKFCGTIGDLGTISFYPTKNLGSYGDAGMIVTNNDKIAKKVRMICDHGSETRYVHECLGMNSRLDAIQAAVLSCKLDILDEENEKRREIAQIYNEGFSSEKEIVTPTYALYGRAIIHQYGILMPNRDAVRESLLKKGIPTAIHYPIALHLQPAFLDKEQGEGTFPIAESVTKSVLNLPIHPYLKEENIMFIIDSVLEAKSKEHL